MKLHQQPSTVVVPTVIVTALLTPEAAARASSRCRRLDLQPVPKATVAHNPSHRPCPESPPVPRAVRLDPSLHSEPPLARSVAHAAAPRALPRSEPPPAGSVALATPRAPLSAGSVAHDRATARAPSCTAGFTVTLRAAGGQIHCPRGHASSSAAGRIRRLSHASSSATLRAVALAAPQSPPSTGSVAHKATPRAREVEREVEKRTI